MLERLEVADTEGVVALPGAAGVLALPVVAIATSCVAPLARARIAAAGLRGARRARDLRPGRAAGKPAPDSYLLAAERLGLDPADCLVLEDAPAGVAAGRAAGLRPCGPSPRRTRRGELARRRTASPRAGCPRCWRG